MNTAVIRFRCPRCGRIHSVASSKAMSAFVCPGCFAPMSVPELSLAHGSGIPTAEAISIPPPEPEPGPEARPAGRRARVAVANPPRENPVEDPTPAPSGRPSRPKVEPSVGEPDPSRWRARAGWAAVVAVGGLIAAVGVAARLARPEKVRPGEGRIAPAGSPSVPAIEKARAGDTPIRRPETSRPKPAPGAPAGVHDPALAPTVAITPAASTPEAARATPAHAVAGPARPEPPGDNGSRRRQTLDQETLRKQLASVPELALTQKTALLQLNLHGIVFAAPRPVRYARTPQGKVADPSDVAANQLTNRARVVPMLQPFGPREAVLLFSQFQPELASLPWQLGDDCHLAREPAEDLQALSRALRDLLSQTTPAGDTRPDPEALRPLLLGAAVGRPGPGAPAFPRAGVAATASQESWVNPAAIPALLQLLMAERTTTREVLVDVLSRIPGDRAVAALARLAVFDLAPGVRDRAILALRDRPAESYRPTLLRGLSYPWPPAADHAAEALVALGDRGAISSLVGMLDDPDPQAPTTVRRGGNPTTLVRTLVKINHLKNCLLCHDPSRNSTGDLVRGQVPTQGMELPPPRQYYGGQTPGVYVRAEVTYLRQDFSVTQPVESADPWPTQQRFDYLVSERPVDARNPIREGTPKAGEGPRPGPTASSYPQRESVLFALRELTGKDLGTTAEDWQGAVPAAGPEGRPPRR